MAQYKLPPSDMNLRKDCLFILVLLVSFCQLSRGQGTQDICEDIIECHCYDSDEGGGVVALADCVNKPELTYIPAGLPVNLTSLSFHNTGLEEILKENITDLVNLKVMDFSENAISWIEEGAFQKQGKLEELRLRDNRLVDEGIPSNAFSSPSNLLILDLQSNNLTKIPPGIFQYTSNLKSLDMSRNRINMASGTSPFTGLNSLLYLTLADNAITSLQKVHLSGLGSLTTVFLQNNDIAALPANAFSEAVSLELVRLTSNAINSVDPSAFSGLSSLAELYLDNNQLPEVPTAAFDPLVAALTTLDLSGNLFSDIGYNALGKATKVENLYLGNMGSLVDISDNAFNNLKDLKLISISGNANVTRFTPTHLQQQYYIEHIQLSSNGFVTLREDIFDYKDELFRVDIDGNPFYCDCSAYWMSKVANDGTPWASTWKTSSTPPRCATPKHLMQIPDLEGDIPEMFEKDFCNDGPIIHPDGPQEIQVNLTSTFSLEAILTGGIPISTWVTPTGEVISVTRYDHMAMAESLIQDRLEPEERLVRGVDEHEMWVYLHINNVTYQDNGIFTLWASNGQKNANTTFNLNVTEFPTSEPPKSHCSKIGTAHVQYHLVIVAILLFISVGED